jgi:CRP/FNR family cyclic AMP-dependent transcriptional regulator
VSFFDYPSQPPAPLGDAGQADYFLPDATDQEWATLLGHTRHRWFSAGDAVIAAGAGDRSLYLILDGSLEVLVERGRRGHRRVASLGAGSVIGELSFFDGGTRSALVRAVTAAELAELSPAEFEALADADPVLARRLLFELGRILARRLRASQEASVAGGVG